MVHSRGLAKAANARFGGRILPPTEGVEIPPADPKGLDLAADAASPNFATKLPHPEVRVK